MVTPSKLNTTLMVGVGRRAFDFHIGRVKQAPSWMQSLGLEWLFRLIQEPRNIVETLFNQQPKVPLPPPLQLMLGIKKANLISAEK